MTLKHEKDQSLIVRNAGQHFTRRVSKAVMGMPWYWSIISLAWTAGPVTYIALNGGYYLGYGKTASPEVFIYFFGYTFIAGLIAVAAKIIRTTVFEPQRTQAERLMTETIDQLFDLYHCARNAHVGMYAEDERPIMAAWWGCRSATASVEMLEEAILDISGDKDLAYAIRRIEFYRKQGFTDLVKQEYTRHQKVIEQNLQKLAVRFPGLAHQLQQRFAGNAPSLRFGQPRPAGFIERLVVMEADDALRAATADDVIAMINFTIELILGRVVIALYPEFKGFRRLDEARARFDRLLSEYRLLLRKRNGRMRALIVDLGTQQHIKEVQVAGASSKQLLASLKDMLHHSPQKGLGRRRYQQIVEMNQQLRQLLKQMAKEEAAYNKRWQQDGERLIKRLSTPEPSGNRRSALVIHERKITLSHKQKGELVEAAHKILQESAFSKTASDGTGAENAQRPPLEMDDYKHIAVQLLNVIDGMIHISRAENQLAVEASREADFGDIEPSLAAQTKLGWARIAVEEVQQDRIQISHRLAAFLTHYLKIPLGTATIDFLVMEYGASREYLENLQSETPGAPQVACKALQAELLDFPKWETLVTAKPRG